MTEKLDVFAVRTLTQREYFAPGHRACQGCAEALAVRLVAKALGRNAIVAAATGCMEIVSSPFPFTSWRVPWFHVAFENAAAVASGIESGLKALMRKGLLPYKKIVTIAMAGDGGTADIGIQALSGALERGHDMIYICTDNEAYMNTGIQRSSSTPFGASTTTSPSGKVKAGQVTWKKNMPAIAAAHNIPYVATACPSYPIDLVQKVKKAAEIEGPAYLHILSVCPTGWRSAPELSIRLGRLAAETGAFPIYEVEYGKYKINIDFPQLRPLKEYTRLQGRFRHLTDEMLQEIEKRIHKEYEQLREKATKGV
ncbi:MAG: pyruvate ferredoxin oxidoreductase [Deltaproteobacteria bacterium RBG_16_48_10]|nr:MAG: pyruvate ferredoxin oxidoreductase [Deltaproteobacteria bacterium RBG_16_48_10]